MKLLSSRLLGAILICLFIMNISISTYNLQRKRNSRRKQVSSVGENSGASETTTILTDLKAIFSMNTVANINDVLWRCSSVVPKLGVASGFLTAVLQVVGVEDENKRLLKEISQEVREIKDTLQRNHDEIKASLQLVNYAVELDNNLENIERMVELFLQLCTDPNMNQETRTYNAEQITTDTRYQALSNYLESLGGTLRGMNLLDINNKFGIDRITIVSIIANYDNGGTEKLKPLMKELTCLAMWGAISYWGALKVRNITPTDNLQSKLTIGLQQSKGIFEYLQKNKVSLAKAWIDAKNTSIVEWSNTPHWNGQAPLPQRILNKLWSKFEVKSSALCTPKDRNGGQHQYNDLKTASDTNGWCVIDVAEDVEYNVQNARPVVDSIKNSLNRSIQFSFDFKGKPGFCFDNWSNGERTYFSSNIRGYIYEDHMFNRRERRAGIYVRSPN